MQGFALQPVATSTSAKLLGLLQGSPRKCPQGPDGEPLSPAIGTSVVHINAFALQQQQQYAAQGSINVAFEVIYNHCMRSHLTLQSQLHVNGHSLDPLQGACDDACVIMLQGSYSPVVHDNPSFNPEGSPESEASTRHSAYDTAAESPSAASPFAGASVQWGSPMSSAPSSRTQSPISHRHGFQYANRWALLSFALRQHCKAIG